MSDSMVLSGLGAGSGADMDVAPLVGGDTMDVEDALLADHEAPMEKTDADFFNGALRKHNPRCAVAP